LNWISKPDDPWLRDTITFCVSLGSRSDRSDSKGVTCPQLGRTDASTEQHTGAEYTCIGRYSDTWLMCQVRLLAFPKIYYLFKMYLIRV